MRIFIRSNLPAKMSWCPGAILWFLITFLWMNKAQTHCATQHSYVLTFNNFQHHILCVTLWRSGLYAQNHPFQATLHTSGYFINVLRVVVKTACTLSIFKNFWKLAVTSEGIIKYQAWTYLEEIKLLWVDSCIHKIYFMSRVTFLALGKPQNRPCSFPHSCTHSTALVLSYWPIACWSTQHLFLYFSTSSVFLSL